MYSFLGDIVEDENGKMSVVAGIGFKMLHKKVDNIINGVNIKI